MNNNSSYIIEKLTIDVNTSSVQQGYEIKNNVRSFIDQHVVSAIENYLNKLSKKVSNDQVLRIDKLTLTVNSKYTDWATSSLQLAIQQEFDKAIAVAETEMEKGLSPYTSRSVSATTEIVQPTNSHLLSAPEIQNLTVITKNEHVVVAWISFLQDGTTLWLSKEMATDAASVQEEKLLAMMLGAREKLLANRTRIIESPVAFNRLIRQFSSEFLTQFVSILQKESTSFSYQSVLVRKEQQIKAFINVLTSGLSSESKQRFWELLFRFLRLKTNQTSLSDIQLLKEFKQLISIREMVRPISVIMPPAAPSPAQPKTEGLLDSKNTQESQEDNYQAKKVSAESNDQQKLNSNDPSIGYIYLLEWLHQLQSSSVPLSHYVALQSQLLKESGLLSNESITPHYSQIPSSKDKDSVDSSNDKHKVDSTRYESKVDSSNDKSNIESSLGKTEEQLVLKGLDRDEKVADSIKSDVKQTDHSEHSDASNANRDEMTGIDKKEIGQKADTTSDGDPIAVTVSSEKQVADKNETTIDSDTGLIDNQTFSDTSAVTTTDSNRSKAQKEKEAITSARKKSTANQPHLLVENAGLIIIHPFLKHFFTGIGLLNDSNKLTDPALAAHVLHYIATGRENDFEQQMLFEKYLAGMDQQESIAREVVISDAIKQEVESLWNAVRSNWAPMKTASAAAMRETFIQRPGKLMHESPNPRLVIERKTVDILLGQLGWTISIIRLPWMEEIIFVEW